MAINWGALAGGATKGFVDTYKMLSEEEERELALKEKRDRMAREAQARTAALETIGRANTDTYAPELQARGAGTAQAKALEQQNAGFGSEGYQEASRATAGALSREAVPTEMKSRVYKESEAVGDYARRLAAIDPDKALATGIQARQLKKAEREEDIQAQFDTASKKFQTDLALITGTAETSGMKGMAELAKKNGLNVKFVEGANGTGRIEVVGKDGKVSQTFTDTQTAADALADIRTRQFFSEMTPLAGSPKEVATLLAQQQTMRLAERKDIREEKELPGKMAYTAAQTENARAQAKQALSSAASANLKADEAREYNELRTKMLKLLEEKNPTAEQAQELRQLARRAAILNPSQVLVTKAYTDPETGIAKTITTNVLSGEVQESMKEAGVPGPAAMKAAQSGINPKTGKAFTAEDIAAWNRTYPNTPFPGPTSAGQKAPASAIPAAAPTGPVATRGTAIAAGNRVPEPPPKEIVRGTNRLPNPAYVEWEKKYGQQYNAQQR